MALPVGTCVAVITVHDAGWVTHVHANDIDHDVDLYHARENRTFPQSLLIPLVEGRAYKTSVLQGPFKINIKASLKSGYISYKARATRLNPDGSQGITTLVR